MMIGNLIKCEGCGRELQPEDLLVGTNEKGDLIRGCRFCNHEVVVK